MLISGHTLDNGSWGPVRGLNLNRLGISRGDELLLHLLLHLVTITTRIPGISFCEMNRTELQIDHNRFRAKNLENSYE